MRTVRAQQIRTVVRNTFFIFLFSLLIFLLSCQTNAPKTTANPLVDGVSAIPLEPGALVYLTADVQTARPLLELLPIAGINDKQVKQIIDKAKSTVVGVYPAETNKQLQVVAWGNFPAGAGGMALDLNKGWKKQRTPAGYAYWYSQEKRLSVTMNPSQIFAAISRTDAPVEPLGTGITFPDGFNEFRKGSFLALWMADPSSLIAKQNLPIDFKVDQVFISFLPFVSPEDTDYICEAVLRLEMPGQNEARVLVGMLAMARLFAPAVSETDPEAGLSALLGMLLANPPEQEGKSITIKTEPLTSKDIALLFRLFSL